ncbi:hypothetical protein MSG28_012173 [Choristoneura fumiferana]|uniref:Uncharacterized protein n=1 Tax=Choristoneura fumiferana TaxID=7141 RepID=A0ACC0KC19_CHOFU|nr:hypothetical protein MSG28_012173 [Choristoneura fumiferana]
MIVIVLFILLQVIGLNFGEPVVTEVSERKIPEDGRLNFTELARKYGFRAEEIEVETEDGYLITVFRIRGKKKPVLVVHGMGGSSNTWLLRGKKSLAVALAIEGYDVWCGNVRGNKYGRKHVSLNPDKDDKFWDFSWHEIGLYDWRAIIDRVLKETKESKLNAIGHSQAVTSLLVLLSTKPEYNDKVNLNIALAPVAYLNKIGPGFTQMVKIGPIVFKLLDFLGINELFSENSIEKNLLQLFCTEGYVTKDFCREGIYSWFGDPDGIEAEFFPVIVGQQPAGVSKKILRHYNQVALSGNLAQYDYGVEKNMLLYGTSEPPEYNLSKVTAKMVLLYGENDLVATPTNVEQLASALPNVLYLQAIEKKEWTHTDFTWSKEMDKYLFRHITKLLRKYDW